MVSAIRLYGKDMNQAARGTYFSSPSPDHLVLGPVLTFV